MSKRKKLIIAAGAGVLMIGIIIAVFVCSSGRRAMKQFNSAPVLHAKKTAIYDGNEEVIALESKTIYVTPENQDVVSQLKAALNDGTYNSVCLQFNGEMLDIADEWRLSEQAESVLDQAVIKCAQAKKYLFIDINDYPESYNCWYDSTDFRSQVASLWGAIAKKLEGEKYVGAYILSHFPRSGSTEEVSSLTFLEEFLQSICDSIRKNDELHMICIGAMKPYLEDQDKYHAFPYVKDRNFSYITELEDLEFYTKQTQQSMDGAAHLVYNSSYWHHVGGVDTFDTIRGKSIAFTTNDYQTRESDVFEATEDKLFARIGAYVDPADNNGGGELRIKELKFVECDEHGKEIKTVYKMDSSVSVPFDCLGSTGDFNEGSVYEDGTAYLESIIESTFFYVRDLNIPLDKGKYYKVIVTMKQRGMSTGFDCTAAAQLYTCTEYTKLNKKLIEDTVNTLFEEAKAVGVPILFNDIGVTENVTEEKGKSNYLKDVYAVIEEIKQNYINS